MKKIFFIFFGIFWLAIIAEGFYFYNINFSGKTTKDQNISIATSPVITSIPNPTVPPLPTIKPEIKKEIEDQWNSGKIGGMKALENGRIEFTGEVTEIGKMEIASMPNKPVYDYAILTAGKKSMKIVFFPEQKYTIVPYKIELNQTLFISRSENFSIDNISNGAIMQVSGNYDNNRGYLLTNIILIYY